MYISDAQMCKVLDLSFHVGLSRNTAELERAASTWLCEHIPADLCAFHEFTSAPPAVRINLAPHVAEERDLERLAREHAYGGSEPDHPLWNHYFVRQGALRPLRLSDVIDDRHLFRTAAFNEVLRHYSIRRQIVIVHERVVPRAGCAYVPMRTSTDFTDAELALATAVQPVLIALHQALAVTTTPPAANPVGGVAGDSRARLTESEACVLELLARGLTATAISHVRRTSVRTTRKQLESIYGKLGVHDRLQAVTQAARAGLLHPPADTPSGRTAVSTRP